MSHQVCVEYPLGFTFSELAGNLRIHNVTRCGVISVDRRDPIHEAAALMVQKHISCLPVKDGASIAGMLSDKDLLKSFHDSEYLPGLVEDYMTDTVIGFDMEDPIADIWQCFIEHPFRHAPILMQERLAGMITGSDLVRVFLKHARAVSPTHAHPRKSDCLLAEDAMKRSLPGLTPDATLAEAMDMIITRHAAGIPVVSQTMQLLGIITEKDILRQIRRFDVMTAKTEDCMTRDVVTFGPKSSLSEICEYLLGRDFHQVPIVDEGTLVGLITRSHILRARLRSFKIQTH